MSFPLQNFEAHLPKDIREKGKDYYDSGNVDNLAQDGDGAWTADVYGTDDYTVEVEIANGEVTDWSCDCPYDWGDTCKHVAAVLFAIRDEAAAAQPVAKRRGRKTNAERLARAETIGFTPVTPSSVPKEKPGANNPLRQIIDKLDATELRSVMHYLAQRQDEVKAYLLTKYAHLITTASKGQYAALVKSIIEAHGGGGRRRDFEYREASRLGDRLYKLLADAKEPMGSLPLVYLCEEVVRQLASVYQDADDSSGSMGSAMEQSFSLLQGMAEEGETPADVVRYIFEYALKESSNKDYQGWDWAGNLRSIASAAVRTPAEADRLMQVLDQSIRTDSKEKYRDYATEEAELLKMELIKKFRSEQEAEAYLHTRLHHSRFREKALENALKAGRHDEVRRLANDGIAQDAKDKPGLVTRWKQWLIRLAEATGDTSAQAAHLEELYLDRGEMSYYRQLKQLLPKADFDKKVEQFIRHFREREARFAGIMFNSKVAEILVEENRMDDLMAELRKAPSLYLLNQYSARLSDKFKAVYLDLYDQCVRREMELSSSRDGYQKCAGYVNKILQLGGQAQAQQIVQDWRAQYPRRPAMLDELRRFKF